MTAAGIDYALWVSRSDAFKMLCVQNYGTSGTLFLQSLLDSHPGILSLPGLTLSIFFDAWRSPPGSAVDAGPSRALAQLLPLFDRHHASWRDWGMDRLGDDRAGSCAVDREAYLVHFEALFQAGGGESRRRVLCAAYLAYAFSIGRAPPERATIVFPLHGGTLDTVADIEADFPGALYLHMVRHPVSCGVSIARHIDSQGRGDFTPALERALEQVLLDRRWIDRLPAHGDRPYSTAIASRSRAFRLEALHGDPRGTLTDVAAFAGLAWDEALMQSTVSGLAWWNRAESPTLSGFDPAIPERGVRENTRATERLAIRLAALPKIAAWGYPDAQAWVRRPAWLVRAAFLAASLVPLAGERRLPNENSVFAAIGAFSRFAPADIRDWIGRRWQTLAAFAGRDTAPEKAAPVGGSVRIHLYFRRTDGAGLEGASVTLGSQAPRPATGTAAFTVLEDALERPTARALMKRAMVLALGEALARWRRYVALRRILWRGYADARSPAARPVAGFSRDSRAAGAITATSGEAA